MLRSYKTQSNKIKGENKHGNYLQDVRNKSVWLKTKKDSAVKMNTVYVSAILSIRCSKH